MHLGVFTDPLDAIAPPGHSSQGLQTLPSVAWGNPPSPPLQSTLQMDSLALGLVSGHIHGARGHVSSSDLAPVSVSHPSSVLQTRGFHHLSETYSGCVSQGRAWRAPSPVLGTQDVLGSQ